MSDTFTPPHGLGYRRDAEDLRDRRLYKAIPNVDALPDEINNEHLLNEVYDQHVIGSCVGWSSATEMHMTMEADGHRRPFMPSPVALYLWAREIGGYPQEDCGAEIRNAYKAANKIGLPPMSNIKPRYRDSDMPDPSTWVFPEGSIWRKPPAKSHYADAARRQSLEYRRLVVLPELLARLAEGRFVTVGFTVFRNFYGDQGPVIDVPDPRPGERSLGGHAVLAIGYSKPRRRVIFRNQWGQTAHEGTPNFTLSFDLMQSEHSSDWWCSALIEGGTKAA